MDLLQDLLLVSLGALQLLLLQLHGFQLPEPLLLDLGGTAVGGTPMSVVSVLKKGRLISTLKLKKPNLSVQSWLHSFKQRSWSQDIIFNRALQARETV